MNLQNWIDQARESWREHNPARFKELTKNGTLEDALREAAESTLREISSLEESGFTSLEAWEITREKYLFPPPEEDLEDDSDEDDYRGARLFNEAMALQSDILRILRENEEEMPPEKCNQQKDEDDDNYD